MNEILLPVLIVVALVAFVLNQQIRKITTNLDNESNSQNSNKAYSLFAGTIQHKLRQIKNDIDSSKAVENPTYKLNKLASEEKTLERISNLIRKLVFFETLNYKNKSKSKIENELFMILSEIDELVINSLENGQELSDELRNTLANEFVKLQNS